MHASVKGLTICIGKEEEAEEEQAPISRVHHGIIWHMHAVSSELTASLCNRTTKTGPHNLERERKNS